MDEVMQVAFEFKEKLSDAEYMKLVEKIMEVNTSKHVDVMYGSRTVSDTPMAHIQKLQRRYKHLSEKFNRETTRYMRIIADLTDDNMKLRKEISDWEDDDYEDESA